MQPEIIYQDDSILVLNKPSGWVVNEADTARGDILQNWLKDNFNYPLNKDKLHRSGIVHRLDKETSGVLIVAKDIKSFECLQKQFKDRKVTKTYLGLLHGEIKEPSGKIKTSVGRLPWNRERFGVLAGGREAETDFLVKSILSKDKDTEKYSLVEFYPKSGRTHQLRIHSKYIGHPIVSDSFYAGRKTSRKDRLWCPRLFLHASIIKFNHPKKREVVYKAELAEDLAKVLSGLH